MKDILDGLPTQIEGYDLAAEKRRYDYPDIRLEGVVLNRATAKIDVRGDMDPPRHAKVREEHVKEVFTTTHGADSPVVELGWPSVGPYVASAAGTYMDLQLGVAQKLLDENHPYFLRAIDRLVKHRLIWRREINTDDFFDLAPAARAGGLHTPQQLAALISGLAKEAFPIVGGGYKVFFSNSGTEAIEAGIKLAQIVRYKRFVQKHGHEVLARVMAALDIPRHEVIEARDKAQPEPVYKDYPFFLFAMDSAFHGRTLGSLSLTSSKKRAQLGFSKLRWVRHVEWARAAEEMAALMDPREIGEILDAPGGLRAVIEAGRVPKDLAAAFVAEPFQGEGGYRAADRAQFQALGALLKRHGILFVLDEVQTFGRTGTAFFCSQLLNEPDIICTAKGAVVGVTLGRAELEQHLHSGWHSNTWGGGKIFDNEMAYATVDALKSYRDPVFDGLPYFENCRVKGLYLSTLLERVRARHPETLLDHSGRGLMHGITVRRREELIPFAWRHGLKLLGCGLAGEASRIRLLFLADTTAREVEDFAATLDRVLGLFEARRPERGGARAPAGTSTALAAALAATLLSGCPDANPVDGIKTQIEAKPAAETVVDASQAKRAVQAYQAQKGENPPSIEALEAVTGRLSPPPAGHVYTYDPATGEIDIVKAPGR
jgi:4-aminobutyrate aminotransferase-like enzyme